MRATPAVGREVAIAALAVGAELEHVPTMTGPAGAAPLAGTSPSATIGTCPRHRVAALAYDGLAPFELGVAVEAFAVRRPELDVRLVVRLRRLRRAAGPARRRQAGSRWSRGTGSTPWRRRTRWSCPAARTCAGPRRPRWWTPSAPRTPAAHASSRSAPARSPSPRRACSRARGDDALAPHVAAGGALSAGPRPPRRAVRRRRRRADLGRHRRRHRPLPAPDPPRPRDGGRQPRRPAHGRRRAPRGRAGAVRRRTGRAGDRGRPRRRRRAVGPRPPRRAARRRRDGAPRAPLPAPVQPPLPRRDRARAPPRGRSSAASRRACRCWSGRTCP